MRNVLAWATALLALPASLEAQKQKMPPLPPPSGPAVAPAPAQNASARITLEEAIRLALQHNHALQAARTTILQNQAQETTANLRPNPVISWDTQFIPLFQPSNFTASYFENQAQFDLGIGYLFERGKKRQHRLQAAKDQTAVTTSRTTTAFGKRWTSARRATRPAT
jgi:cobalt-zinc-cadmium efflux system outer membrane protein